MNQDKLSQTSKQGCIIHLPSALVTAGDQLCSAASPPASHFPQKIAKLCKEHIGDKNLVGMSNDKTGTVSRQELSSFLQALHGAVLEWGQLAWASATRAWPPPSCA